MNFDFVATGFALVITDTGGNHADLNDEYASLPTDMKAVAAELGAKGVASGKPGTGASDCTQNP